MALISPYLASIPTDIPTFLFFIVTEIQIFSLSGLFSSAEKKILKIKLQLKFVCARQTLIFFDRYLLNTYHLSIEMLAQKLIFM